MYDFVKEKKIRDMFRRIEWLTDSIENISNGIKIVLGQRETTPSFLCLYNFAINGRNSNNSD